MPENRDEPEARDEQESCHDRDHLAALLAAARITTVRLDCHRDLWAFLVGKAAGAPHFRLPGKAKDIGNGRCQVALSGPSLIAVLTVLREGRRCPAPGEDPGDWAQANVLYDSISKALRELEDGARAPSDDHVDITIDLRKPAPGPADPPAEGGPADDDRPAGDGEEPPDDDPQDRDRDGDRDRENPGSD